MSFFRVLPWLLVLFGIAIGMSGLARQLLGGGSFEGSQLNYLLASGNFLVAALLPSSQPSRYKDA